ncbi:MAG TPA: sulfurtransferase [Gaiellaceae bacterium]|nr:sulfurtransferase [Gaiellaceae bacterium]
MRYRFVDCAYALDRVGAGREAYLGAHVPGASFLGIDELSDLSVQGQGRHPLPSADAFAAAASRAGIGEGVFVVAYDHGGAGGAARLWWLLRHFGHDDVAVLGGGFESWLGPVRSGVEEVEPADFVPRPRDGDTIQAEELAGRLGEPGLVVVDARAPERFRGEVEPIDPVAGRIPGAVNWPYTDADEVPEAVRAADEIVVYCGSGITACVDLLALAGAGRPDAKLYPGSWSDWCKRGLPAETG